MAEKGKWRIRLTSGGYAYTDAFLLHDSGLIDLFQTEHAAYDWSHHTTPMLSNGPIGHISPHGWSKIDLTPEPISKHDIEVKNTLPEDADTNKLTHAPEGLIRVVPAPPREEPATETFMGQPVLNPRFGHYHDERDEQA